MSENGLIYWSQEFSLQLQHFQGQVDKNNPHHASLRTSVEYLFYNEEKKTSSKYKIKINKITVKSFFTPSKSWMRREVINEVNLPSLLKHEQGHFDLSEEYARKINLQMNKFSGKSYSCKNTQKEKATDEIKQMLDKKFKVYTLELKKAHNQYDEETNHGLILHVQKKYNIRFSMLRK